MKKEILTREKIKLDYKLFFFGGIKALIIIPIFLMVLVAFMIFLSTQMRNANIVKDIIGLTPPIFFIFICYFALFYTYKRYRYIRDDKFIITTDKLVGIESKESYYGSAFASSFSKPHTLHFASYGQYPIPRGKNNRFSEIFEMDDNGVYNYSTEGDTFYLVIYKNKKILLAYNTKLFELQQ